MYGYYLRAVDVGHCLPSWDSHVALVIDFAVYVDVVRAACVFMCFLCACCCPCIVDLSCILSHDVVCTSVIYMFVFISANSRLETDLELPVLSVWVE